MILDRILEEKRREVAKRKAAIPVSELQARITDAPAPRDFAAGLCADAGIPAVIAEVKKASPSKGLIRPDFQPVAIARAYESGGAAAVSVLTDEKFFQGSLDYLAMVRRAISLPVLRKDFIIDDYQVYEARAAGADAVLLIVAALDKETIMQLMNIVGEIGMQCLVEVHDEREIGIALQTGAAVIGINNRNLQTFEVTLETTACLLRSLDRGLRNARIVSESGIFTHEDMVSLGAMGVDAVLVGEALMRESDVEAKLRELIS